MSIFKKIAEFFTGTKPADTPAQAPYKVEASTLDNIDTYTGMRGASYADPVAKANAAPVAKSTAKPAAMTAKKTAPAQPKVKVKKVQTAPIVVAPKFKAVDLETKSKNELLDLAKQQGAKVNARMGKAAIIAKLVK